MTASARTVILLLPLLLLGGCDLFGSSLVEIVVEATGTVVSAETGQPIQGLGVAIEEVPAFFSATVAVATTATDADGRFSIRYETSRAPRGHPNVYYVVAVNSPYDPDYTTFRRDAFPPPDAYLDLGMIELEETEAP